MYVTSGAGLTAQLTARAARARLAGGETSSYRTAGGLARVRVRVRVKVRATARARFN